MLLEVCEKLVWPTTVGRYWFEGCFRALEVGKNLLDLAVNRVHVDSRSFVVVEDVNACT